MRREVGGGVGVMVRQIQCNALFRELQQLTARLSSYHVDQDDDVIISFMLKSI